MDPGSCVGATVVVSSLDVSVSVGLGSMMILVGTQSVGSASTVVVVVVWTVVVESSVLAVLVVVGAGCTETEELEGTETPTDGVGVAATLEVGTWGMTGTEVAPLLEVGIRILVRSGGSRVGVELATASDDPVGVDSGTLTEMVGRILPIRPPEVLLAPGRGVDVEEPVPKRLSSKPPELVLVDEGMTAVEALLLESVPKRPPSKSPDVLVGVANGVVALEAVESVPKSPSNKPPEVLVEDGMTALEVLLVESPPRRSSSNPPDVLVAEGDVAVLVTLEEVESPPRRPSSKPPDELVLVAEEESAVEVEVEVEVESPKRLSSKPLEELVLVAEGDDPVDVLVDVESPFKLRPRRSSDVLVEEDVVLEVDVEAEESLPPKRLSSNPPDEEVDDGDVVESVVSVSEVVESVAAREIPVWVVLALLSVLLDPPRRPPKIPERSLSSVVVDDEVLVAVGCESVVAEAVTSATVDCFVVVEAAPVATPVLAVPVIVCVLPFSSTESVMGTITTSGSESLDEAAVAPEFWEVVVLAVVPVSEFEFRNDSSQPRLFEWSEEPNN
jgi:hypothetical protein